jgi:dynein heavy chain, axonemal
MVSFIKKILVINFNLIFFLFPVTNSLTDLSDFIHKADQGLLQVVDNYETLVSIMAFLLQVKERAVTTDIMFEPMRETIDLLKFYDMEISEEVNVLLQELPEQWNNTKKLAVTVKQQVAPLQATEVVSIRNRIANFDLHISVFRDIFRTYEFFKYDCEVPYLLLDRISDDIFRLENEMTAINESGSLFEVNVPEFKLLKQCRRELRMLKVLCSFDIIMFKEILNLFYSNYGIMFLLCERALKIGRRLRGGKLTLKIWTLSVKSLLKMFVYWTKK